MAKKTDPLAIDFTQRTPQRVDPFIDLVPQGSNMPRPADITGAIPMGELNIPDVRGDARFFGGYKDSPTPQQNPNFGAAVEGYMAPPAQAPDIFAPQAPAHSPQQGSQAQPQSVAGAVDARMPAPTQPESQYPRIAEGTEFSDLRIKGYTDEENRRFNQEANIGNAKKGIGERIAAKELAKSLESQGLSRDEINKAIGGDTAETLSNLKAMQAGRSASASGTGIDAKVRDNAVQAARYDEDGTTPKNAEGRAVGYMDWADSVGSDPQGKSNYDSMTKSERNQYDRTVKSMSRGTKNPNSERLLKGMMDRVDKKRERAFNKQQSELLNETAQIAIDKAQGDKEKAYYGKLKSQSEILMKEYQGKSSTDRKKEITAELGQINEAFKAGYQEAEKTFIMTSPDGRTLNVPESDVERMQSYGAQLNA